MDRHKFAAGFLSGQVALAAVILWGSGQFDAFDIAKLLDVREDAVARTLHMAKDGARMDEKAARNG
jgi:hypothetical protein